MEASHPGAAAKAKRRAKQARDKRSSAHRSGTHFDLEGWKNMVVNPGEHPPVRTPSISPFTGAVRTFTRTINLASTGVNDEFAVVVKPNLDNNISFPTEAVLAAGWDGVYDIGSAAVSDESVTFSAYAKSIYSAGGTINVNTPTEQVVVNPVKDEAIDLYYFPVAIPSNCDIYFKQDAYMGVGVRNALTKVWTEIIPVVTTAPSTATLWNSAGVTYDGLCFYTTDNEKYNEVTLSDAGGGLAYPTLAKNTFGTFSSQAVTLSKVSKYRVVSMSALATYSGNMFNDGGVMSAARTRAGWIPTEDYYQSLTQLQDHAYRGPLKDGCYVWWLPYDLKELEFRSPNSDLDGTALRFAGRFGDDSGALSVTLTMVVEFYSPLQIFEHEVGPPRDDQFTYLFHELDALPAATCNPAHGFIAQGKKATAQAARNAARPFVADPVGMSRIMFM
jgi:hypothetical protein